jgi:hypothetical protein
VKPCIVASERRDCKEDADKRSAAFGQCTLAGYEWPTLTCALAIKLRYCRKLSQQNLHTLGGAQRYPTVPIHYRFLNDLFHPMVIQGPVLMAHQH